MQWYFLGMACSAADLTHFYSSLPLKSLIIKILFLYKKSPLSFHFPLSPKKGFMEIIPTEFKVKAAQMI
jgi:hypothetical protein